VLIPTGRACEDSWLLASALAPFTERLKFLVAARPGVLSPTQAARMTATLDRLSTGCVLINVVTGGDPQENRGDGLFWAHSERYRATEEFMHVYKRILAGESVTFSGEYIKVEDGRVSFPPVQQPHPPLYFGGSSAAAHDVVTAADLVAALDAQSHRGSVGPSYSRRNRPRRCNSGTIFSTKSSSPSGRNGNMMLKPSQPRSTNQRSSPSATVLTKPTKASPA
jgi:hypothetical protein